MLVLNTIHACSELLLSGKTFAIDIKLGLNLLTRFQPFGYLCFAKIKDDFAILITEGFR